MPPKRLLELDVLRAYGILSVVALHYFLFAAHNTGMTRALTNSTHLEGGVDLFFAISGFVISDVLAPLWTAPKTQQFSSFYVAFMERRFWRLWPAMAFWLTLCLMLCAMGGVILAPSLDVEFKNWAYGLFYLANFAQIDQPTSLGYFWSLAVEWQFYLLLPLLLVFVPGNLMRLGLLASLFVLGFAYRFGGQNWWLFRFDALLAGIFAYMALRLAGIRVRTPFLKKPEMARLTTILILAFILTDQWFGLAPFASQGLRSAASGFLVYLAAHDEGYTSDFGMTRSLLWLGERSYSIYLAHIPTMLLVMTFYAELTRRPIDFGHLWPFFMILTSLLLIPIVDVSFRRLEGLRGGMRFLKPQNSSALHSGQGS